MDYVAVFRNNLELLEGFLVERRDNGGRE